MPSAGAGMNSRVRRMKTTLSRALSFRQKSMAEASDVVSDELDEHVQTLVPERTRT